MAGEISFNWGAGRGRHSDLCIASVHSSENQVPPRNEFVSRPNWMRMMGQMLVSLATDCFSKNWML